jgi:acyl carrier protein
MMHRRGSHSPPNSSNKISREQALLALVTELVTELRQQSKRPVDVSLSSRLEQDLGIDSLGRTELMLRIERAFRARLPLEVLSEAETVGDILKAMEQMPAIPGFVAPPPQLTAPLPLVEAPIEARTLVDVLEWHVARHPDRLHLTVLQDEKTILGTLTYAGLAERARKVAAGLAAADILPQDRIALMLPTGLDFFIAFFGVLYAGAIPVPIYPPMQLAKIEEFMRRQAGILRNAEARVLVTVPEGLRFATLLRRQVPSIEAVESVQSLSAAAAEIQLPIAHDGTTTALIQYTSGSTGDPKGVVLSHANLLANIREIGEAIGATSAEVFVSWLPLYHDMGLIGAWLGSLYFAASLYVMSPVSFVARPTSWLWAMHRYRATISAAPNFAFEMCAARIDDAQLRGLDLSALKLLANGAEPVSVSTMRRFIERFQPCGFHPEAMAPVYGLAENAVAVTLPPLGRGPVIDRVNREALSGGKAKPAKKGDENAIEFAACGHPLPDTEIRIVDDLGREAGDRTEGRLEFRGPSATSGYFRNQTKTRALFHDGWLDTGDRAYIANGDLFVTGRTKDIIIRAGQHIYPHEVEEALGEIDGIQRGGVAVFGIPGLGSGTERMIIVAETSEADPLARDQLRANAQKTTAEIVGAPAEDIVLVVPGTVPKTSSGKLRRAAAKELYSAGLLQAAQPALRQQLLRLWIAGIGPQLSRLRRIISDRLYVAWWWVVLATCFAIAWPAVMLLPSRQWRWTFVHWLARATLFAMAVPLSVTGLSRVPRDRAVLMFNHSSYMDGLIVAAVLPHAPTFVAKNELAKQFFAGTVLRRLGVLFVERYDLSGGLADTASATEIARKGALLVIFPEGTFTRRPGLLAFHLTPFKIACDANIPVVPGVIRGTRSILRSDQWFPRRGAASVDIAEPIKPTGNDFTSVLALRDKVRASILARCGEPDLGELVKPAVAGAPTA